MTKKNTLKYMFYFLLLGVISACSEKNEINRLSELTKRQTKALKIFKDRCMVSGIKISRTVDKVEGIFIMKVRSKDNFDNQFGMDDPYGRDLTGKGYIGSFLRGSYQSQITMDDELKPRDSQRMGFLYVEAIDESDGKRYRYTGSIREYETLVGPISGPKRKIIAKGYVVDRVLATGAAPRYGVTYSDISTMHDREFWIAGSSLKVVDLKTDDVIGERIGYMIDLKQGSQENFRSPWLLAASNACPAFRHKIAFDQLGQTQEFVEKILRPK